MTDVESREAAVITSGATAVTCLLKVRALGGGGGDTRTMHQCSVESSAPFFLRWLRWRSASPGGHGAFCAIRLQTHVLLNSLGKVCLNDRW